MTPAAAVSPDNSNGARPKNSYYEHLRHWSAPVDDQELVAIRNKRLEILMQEIHAELLQPGICHELLIEGATAMMAAELARHVTRLERIVGLNTFAVDQGAVAAIEVSERPLAL